MSNSEPHFLFSFLLEIALTHTIASKNEKEDMTNTQLSEMEVQTPWDEGKI